MHTPFKPHTGDLVPLSVIATGYVAFFCIDSWLRPFALFALVLPLLGAYLGSRKTYGAKLVRRDFSRAFWNVVIWLLALAVARYGGRLIDAVGGPHPRNDTLSHVAVQFSHTVLPYAAVAIAFLAIVSAALLAFFVAYIVTHGYARECDMPGCDAPGDLVRSPDPVLPSFLCEEHKQSFLPLRATSVGAAPMGAKRSQ